MLNLLYKHLKKETGSSLSQERMGMWESAIQEEETKTHGWALYSTNQMNQDALFLEISQELVKLFHYAGRLLSRDFGQHEIKVRWG